MNQQLSLYTRILQQIVPRIRPAILAERIKQICVVGRVTITTPHGVFHIDPVSNLGISLSRRGVYEEEMVRVLQMVLKPGDTFVDLGANEGYFSVLAGGLVSREGRVIAIEPQARLQNVILQNLGLNGIAAQVSLHSVAISDSEGEAVFHLSTSLNSGSSGLTPMTRYALPTTTVRTTTLQTLFRDLSVGYVDLLKIDIEGYEYEAIIGSPDLFKSSKVRSIVLEIHPEALAKRNKRPADITDFLSACGYRPDLRFSTSVFTR